VLPATSIVPFALMGAGLLVVLVAVVADRLARERAAPEPEHSGPERRGSPRVTVARPVMVRHAGGEVRTFALDLSEGGILIADPASLAVGDTVNLTVEFDDGREPLTTDAEVVRRTPQGYVGLRFA
jgi:hypothetical protein